MEDFWLALASGAVGAGAKALTKAGDSLAEEVGEDAKRAYVAIRDTGIGTLKSIGARLRRIVGPDARGTVSPQITQAVLQHAPMAEADENIEEMFAHLLASDMFGDKPHPSFPGLVASLSPTEARAFKEIAIGEPVYFTIVVMGGDRSGAFVYSRDVTPDTRTDVGRLQLLGLVETVALREEFANNRVDGNVSSDIHSKAKGTLTKRAVERTGREDAHVDGVSRIKPSAFGERFARAVLPPKPT